MKKNYKISEDWTGSLYCGITLDWDYTQRTLDISMPGYIKKQLQKYKHDMPKRPQHCPYQPQEKKYGKAAQHPILEDTSSGLEEKEIKVIQRVVCKISGHDSAHGAEHHCKPTIKSYKEHLECCEVTA